MLSSTVAYDREEPSSPAVSSPAFTARPEVRKVRTGSQSHHRPVTEKVHRHHMGEPNITQNTLPGAVRVLGVNSLDSQEDLTSGTSSSEPAQPTSPRTDAAPSEQDAVDQFARPNNDIVGQQVSAPSRGHVPERSPPPFEQGDEEIEASVQLPVAARVHDEKRCGRKEALCSLAAVIVITIVVASSVVATSSGSSPAAMPPTAATCSPRRCGVTWVNANGQCNSACMTDKDCPINTKCFADLKTELDCCSGSNENKSLTPTTSPVAGCSSIRCGSTWADANAKCGVECLDDASCPNREACFDSLDTNLACCSEKESPSMTPNPLQEGCPPNRCGATWPNANTMCGLECFDNESCPDGERCFGELSVTLPCCYNDETRTTTAPTEASISQREGCPTTRCGTTWDNANGQCGQECMDGSACPDGEFCFADLAPTPCGDACGESRRLLRRVE